MVDNFYYFFPRVVNADEYRVLGLEHAFRRPPAVTQLSSEQGPAGAGGTALHTGAAPTLPKLAWHKANDQMWVGHNPHDPPTPERLRDQTEITAWTAVRLADDEYWCVPRVLACTDREPGRASGLPIVITRAEPVKTEIDGRYAELVRQAERVLAAYEATDPESGELSVREQIEFAAAVLGVCYSVTLDELLALKLLTPGAVRVIVLDAIDALEREKALLGRAAGDELDRMCIVSYAQAEAIMQQQGVE